LWHIEVVNENAADFHSDELSKFKLAMRTSSSVGMLRRTSSLQRTSRRRGDRLSWKLVIGRQTVGGTARKNLPTAVKVMLVINYPTATQTNGKPSGELRQRNDQNSYRIAVDLVNM
jgi:hypothetical protein